MKAKTTGKPRSILILKGKESERANKILTTATGVFENQIKNSPLSVTINGNGPCTGKTTAQYLIADFLTRLGYKVMISDDSVSQEVLEGDLRRRKYSAGEVQEIIPQTIHLHIGTGSSAVPTNRKPIRWVR
jgi:hypothetical protein